MGRKLALLIGVESYELLPCLKMPLEDVARLGSVLEDSRIGGFDQVTKLVNPRRGEVELEIEQLFTERNRDDMLFFYFSGHGIRNENDGRLYLGLRDTHKERLRSTAIPATFITELMDESRSQRQVLVLDCCHSGAFSTGFKGDTEVSVGTQQAFKGTGNGRAVLTASDALQFAWEGDAIKGSAAKNSVFTHYLIEGLRTGEADHDGDGVISVDEWFEFAARQVAASAPKQKPKYSSYNTDGRLELARVPEVKAAPLPREIVEAVNSPLSGQRVAIVSDLLAVAQGRNRAMAVSAVGEIRRLLEDDSSRVRVAARAALDELGDVAGMAGMGNPEVKPYAPVAVEPKAVPEAPVRVEPRVEEALAARPVLDRPARPEPVVVKPPEPVVVKPPERVDRVAIPFAKPVEKRGAAGKIGAVKRALRTFLMIGRGPRSTSVMRRTAARVVLALMYLMVVMTIVIVLVFSFASIRDPNAVFFLGIAGALITVGLRSLVLMIDGDSERR